MNVKHNNRNLSITFEGLLRGINILVITSGHDATDHRIYSKLACSLKRMGAYVTVVGMLEHSTPTEVKVISVPKPSTRLKRFLLQPWRCLWAARNYHADIIHFHDAEMLATLPFVKLFWFRRKFVYDVHEDFANLMLVRDWIPQRFKGIVRALTDFIEKKLAVFADGIVGVTPQLTDRFHNKNRITAYNFITHNFFEQAKVFSRNPIEREVDLVHLGTLNLRRANFLIETIKEFHKLRPEAKSLIIGVSQEISKKIRFLLPDRCQLIGEIPHTEIPKILGNVKVGLDIHPWLGPHLKVALPVKICEYMASGCAVVSSSMPVLNQILEKAEKDIKAIEIIEGDNPGDYARAVVQRLEAIEKGENPGSKLQEFALHNMVWENEAIKIANLYLKLLGKACAI